MRVRLILANQSEARFYDMASADSPLQRVGALTDGEERAQDAPPPVQHAAPENEAAAAAERRRFAFSRRLSTAEPRPRKDAAMRFARQIAAELDAARRRDSFDRLVLMAGPAFIGLLRSALSGPVRATLFAEIRRDMLRQDETIVQACVPPEAFL